MSVLVVIPTVDKPHFNKGKRRFRVGKIPEELSKSTPEQIAWAAGLFEGEGSVFAECRKGIGTRDYFTIRMSLAMVDKDAVEQFQSIMGGKINFQNLSHKKDRQDQWKWSCWGYEATLTVYDLFSPWLSSRRKEQFKTSLKTIEDARKDIELLVSSL